MDLDDALAAYRARAPKAEHQLLMAVRRAVLPIFRGRFDSATVEDLCQETAAVVFANLYRFRRRGPGSFARWVYRIARHRKLSELRRGARRSRIAAAMAQTPAPRRLRPWELLQWRERAQLVEDVLEQMDPKYGEALLHLASGGHPDELAEHEQVCAHTIRTRASRGGQRLRAEIGARWSSASPFLETPKTWG